MKNVEGNFEQKQRINLSSLAEDVLFNDKELYKNEEPRDRFLNNIITVFRPVAEASISLETARRRQYYEDILVKKGRKKEVASIIDQLVEGDRQKMKARIKEYPKGNHSILFRLNNKNYKMLYGSMEQDRRGREIWIPGEEAENYDRVSQYLKVLFEEFARLASSKRESLYFSQLIQEVLEPAIVGGLVLEIKKGTVCFRVRPYALIADPYSVHMYLVGMSQICGKSEGEQIVSYRISRLEDCVTIRTDLGKQPLSKADKYDIEQKILKNGVQYLVAKDEPDVQLRMNERGEALFKQKAYQRPRPKEVRQDGVYVFDCSIRQIENYFFAFGGDVEILQPDWLREEFARKYRNAANVYNMGDDGLTGFEKYDSMYIDGR